MRLLEVATWVHAVSGHGDYSTALFNAAAHRHRFSDSAHPSGGLLEVCGLSAPDSLLTQCWL